MYACLSRSAVDRTSLSIPSTIPTLSKDTVMHGRSACFLDRIGVQNTPGPAVFKTARASPGTAPLTLTLTLTAGA